MNGLIALSFSASLRVGRLDIKGWMAELRHPAGYHRRFIVKDCLLQKNFHRAENRMHLSEKSKTFFKLPIILTLSPTLVGN